MKIYFAGVTGIGDKKGVSLTKQNAKHRPMSYYFLRTVKNNSNYIKRYVESGKQGEQFFIKKKASRLYSYVDMIDSTRGFGAEDRFKEFIKAKRRKR